MLNRILGALGRTLITAGTLILLFVAYQLWGTAIHEAQAQKELTAEFDELLAGSGDLRSDAPELPGAEDPPGGEDPEQPGSADPEGSTSTTAVTPVDTLSDWLPQIGDPVAKIAIPDIGITRTVVEGDDDAQLKRGMGHLAGSPLPGQAGNVAIAGHRTTYGQPLHNIDELDAGDLIHFETVQGEFTYEITGHEIVGPRDVEILEDQGDNRLTLIACHPKYSLAQRYIVYAELTDTPAPELPGQEEIAKNEPRAAIDGTMNGQSGSRAPVFLWGFICASIWLAAWLVQVLLRRRMRHHAYEIDRVPSRRERLLTWAPYLVGLPVFIVALYFFFENFSLLLPGSY